jgi:hypothetical protein
MIDVLPFERTIALLLLSGLSVREEQETPDTEGCMAAPDVYNEKTASNILTNHSKPQFKRMILPVPIMFVLFPEEKRLLFL